MRRQIQQVFSNIQVALAAVGATMADIVKRQYLLIRDLEQTMAGKQAKILSDDDVADLLIYASASRHPLRNRVIVLLSAKAGLRAAEISNLTWDMVIEPNGAVATVLELRDDAAKKRSGRRIPLHAELRAALTAWRGVTGGVGPVVVSERGGPMTPLSIVVWFARAFEVIGLDGCSSHSGRNHLILLDNFSALPTSLK